MQNLTFGATNSAPPFFTAPNVTALDARGVRTADADIRGPGSADFAADADGPRIHQTNTFADADHPRI